MLDLNNMPTYTHLHMEAMGCLWEAMLEYRDQNVEFDNYFEAAGTVEMRQIAIRFSDDVLKVWDSMTNEEQDRCTPYDWEFVPRFLKHGIEWDSYGYCRLWSENPRSIADLILASL